MYYYVYTGVVTTGKVLSWYTHKVCYVFVCKNGTSKCKTMLRLYYVVWVVPFLCVQVVPNLQQQKTQTHNYALHAKRYVRTYTGVHYHTQLHG